MGFRGEESTKLHPSCDEAKAEPKMTTTCRCFLESLLLISPLLPPKMQIDGGGADYKDF